MSRVLPLPDPQLAMRAGFLEKVEDSELAGVHRSVFRHEDDDEEEQGPDETQAEDGECLLALPWGLRKRILDNAPPGNVSRPREGDRVTVHLVTVLQDGTLVGSSRGREENTETGESRERQPLEFVLDERPREIIEGLELGIKTMRQGEVAEFTIAPRFAYDDLGSPPLVPPDATVVCEVELITWTCVEDLFRDGRAVKSVLKRGTGETRASKGQETRISLKVTDRHLRTLEEHVDLEHTVGSGDFGCISPVVSEALQTMTEGERATVPLRRFAVGDKVIDSKHSGATVQLHLHRIYRVIDVSPLQDRSLVKRVLKEGSGPEVVDTSRVTLTVTAPAIQQEVEFRVGDGAACDGLELAVAGMKAGETCAVVTSLPAAYFATAAGTAAGSASEAALPSEALRPGEDGRVTLTLQLAAFEGAWQEIPAAERMALAAERKDRGAELFGQQRWALALGRYAVVLEVLDSCEECQGSSAATEMRDACELNRAACLLKLGDFSGARSACDQVLASNPDHPKALYRRASAAFEQSDYALAQADLGRLLQADPKNADARRLLGRVRETAKRYSSDAKHAAARMMEQPPPAARDAGGSAPPPAAVPPRHGGGLLARLPLPCCRGG